MVVAMAGWALIAAQLADGSSVEGRVWAGHG